MKLLIILSENHFNYTTTQPNYIVGKEIEVNRPNILVDGGIFTIKPPLSKGLSLDSLTGEITGIPTEEYQATFIIAYTKSDEIWDIPLELTCGLNNISIVDNITDIFECKSDKKVSSWSIVFDPEGSYDIFISNDGILQFNNYNPIDKLVIIIQASNPASDNFTSISIVISKIPFEYKLGLNVDINDVNEFNCGNEIITNIYYHTNNIIIDNLDELDVDNAYSIWDAKLNSFLSKHNTEYWNYTITAYIYVETEGEYTFVTNNDYSSNTIFIDEVETIKSNQFEYFDNKEYRNFFGYCSLWEYSELTNKVYLTSGYHDFKMIGYYSKKQQRCYTSMGKVVCKDYYDSSTYRLKMKWIKPNTIEEVSIPFYQTKTPYKPVSYLTFDNDIYTVPLNTYFEIPFKFGRGKATECFGSDPLEIDLIRNVLKGSIDKDTTIRMNCKTSTSITNTVSINIKICKVYMKGIVGYYLKSENFDDSCLIPYTPSTDNVNTEIIRLEDGINHSFESEQSVWDGLTPNFASEFGVNWEGYIKIDSNDDYTFNLTSIYGSWLFIDYKEIINHNGNHEWSSVTKTIYLSIGYHFIRVNYMKYIGSSGIELVMKQGKNDEYKVLNDYLYYIPKGDFEYSISYAVYIKDKQIDINIPRVYKGDSVIECTSNPTLPSDLELTDECIIHGIPKSTLEKKSYNITGKLNNGDMASAIIQISIFGSVTPQGIHLIDLNNISEIYTDSVNIILGKETHLSIEVESGFVLYYEFEITPEGFDLNKYTGKLDIIAREILTKYELIINAYYEGSTIPITKTIIVNVTSGCFGDEKTIFFKLDNDINPRTYKIDIQFQDINSTAVTDKITIEPGSMPFYSTPFCLIEGDYILYIYDYYSFSSTKFNYISIYTNGKLVDYIIVNNGERNTHDVNTEIKGPIVEYGKISKEYFLNDFISLIPQSKLLENCEISPELPSCLTFNTSTCGIAGKVNESLPETEFTITAIGLNGITTLFINLTLYDENIFQFCYKQQKSVITVFIHAVEYYYVDPKYWNYNLYKTSEIDFDNRTSLIELKGSDEEWLKNTNYEYSYCLEENEYTSEYIDTKTSNSDGFRNSYIDVLVNNIPVTRKSLSRTEKEGIDSFNGISDFNYNTKWEYSLEYEDGWDDIDKASGLWKETKLSEIESITGNVVYIRKINTFTNTNKYNAFALKVSNISGIIIKVNEKEIFRNNLPNGEITPTMANDMYNTLIDEVFILPMTWLEEEKVIITIELHKYENENNFPQIITYLLKIIGIENDCLILNKYTNPVNESSGVNMANFQVEYGFDECLDSSWYTRVLPAWAIIRYKDHFHSYFNQFGIYFSTTNYPDILSLEGYDDNNWNNIVKYEEITFPENKRRIFTNFNISKMYSAIRVNMTKTIGSGTIDVNDVNFILCPFRYCKAVEGFLPETLIGSEIKLSCKNQSLPGERTFYCGNDKKWEELNTTCEEEPIVIFLETEYTFKAGSSYKDINLFRVAGKEITYSMNPVIGGLEIDNKTGLISGKPYKEQKEKIINFLFTNPYSLNPVTIKIKITILPSERPILIWTNDSIILDAATNYSDLRLFYVTGINITYTIDELPNGFYLDKNTGFINGISIEKTSMECKITAKNQYEIEFTITINIKLPIEPKNIKYEKELNVIFGMNYCDLQPYQCIAEAIKYSINPLLPDGLEFDENNGLISGKVNVEPPSSISYKFTCFNNYGNISNTITIHIEESVEPVIISHVDNITIEGGKEYYEIVLGRITGKNLLYKISPLLPSSNSLKFNNSNGIISGFITSYFETMNITMIISGNSKQVSFTFTLISSIPDYPVIPPSSIISNITFDFGDSIRSTYLFIAVGTNIEITVNPNLPKGITLDSKTGEIYGLASIYVEKTKYTFTIRNPPSVINETIIVEIGFNVFYCESDSGFPKTTSQKGGKQVSIKCGGIKKGMKIRKCFLTDSNKGIWNKVDESECRINSGIVAGIAIGSICAGMLIISIVAVCLLRTGIFRKRVRSQSTFKTGSNLHKIIVDTPENEAPGGIRV